MLRIVFPDSLRTQRRNINNVENFASFQKGDPNPMFEIIFSEDGNTRLHFLRADFITTLNKVKANITVFKGDSIIDSRVSLAICNLTSVKSVHCISLIEEVTLMGGLCKCFLVIRQC